MSELRTNRIVPRDGLISGTGIGGGIIQVKSATITNTTIYVGDQGQSNQARASSSFSSPYNYQLQQFSGTFMDSPATTNAVIYKMQIAAGDQGYKVNIGRDDGNSNEFSRARVPTSITVMEVSG